jgi:alkane 1-monooxygenase
MPLRFLTPFAFLGLLLLGGWLGGAWTFLGAAVTPLFLVVFDALLGLDQASLPSEVELARWLPRLYLVLQVAALAWAAAWVARPAASPLEAAGMTLSAGMLMGVFGFTAAHDMIHSRSAGEQALGLTFLASVFYMHFRISHLHGHHRHAATDRDPASARLGEGLYAFVIRSVAGQLSDSWRLEARKPAASNRMIRYLAIEAAILLTVALLSLRALAFLVAVAILAVFLLETFNYVAHYGLRRRTGADGRVEPLGPQHSWNSGRRMNNAALFNMGWHSDHHRQPLRHYERLRPVDGAAELPSGYAAALATALIPPVWRRRMNPRVASITRERE